MPQRRKKQGVASRAGLVALALLLAGWPDVSVAQDRTSPDGLRAATGTEHFAAEAVVPEDWRAAQLETSSVIGAALCFAVGFGACLLIVRAMLPALVHAQCVEIIRETMDHWRRESDVRVVVLDRASHEPVARPSRARVPAAETDDLASYELQQHRRVDKPIAPAGVAQTGSADSRSADAPNSMLSQIYEQNLHLRDQMRKQSRSVTQ